jgi:hypothetical protein
MERMMCIIHPRFVHAGAFILLIIAFRARAQPVMLESVVPQFIQGRNGTNTQRIPCAYWVHLGGLTASATYRYYNQIIRSTDSPTTDGSGNCIFTNPDRFVRTSSPGFSAAGNYGEFTADEAGYFSGWMVSEPTGNTRFVPGAYLHFHVMLNDGANGTTVVTRLEPTDSVRVLKLDTAVTDSAGTGIFARTRASARDFVLLYDNMEGTGRPLSATFIESDGSDNSTGNNYVTFYSDSVDHIDGAFGALLPNINAAGLRRIERRSATGTIMAVSQDADGHWPSGTISVNPTGGSTPIVLTESDVPLDSSESVQSPSVYVPTRIEVLSAYPNPFNATTCLEFRLPQSALVCLRIFDLNGRMVIELARGTYSEGVQRIAWNAVNEPSGVYFARLQAGTIRSSQKLVLLK